MNNFESTKHKISLLFANRDGFSDAVICSITAIYLYFLKNYNQPIPFNDIPDSNSFVLNEKNLFGRSMANIFLNRIYNNVLKITKNTKTTGQYFPIKKTIAISDAPFNLENYKSLNLSKEQLAIFIKKLKAKVITHELIHACSDNGTLVGFLFREDCLKNQVKLIPQFYTDSSQCSAESLMLEEIVTECLALDIVGLNIPFDLTNQNSKFKFKIKCKNITSTRATLNPIGEYFMRVFPDCVQGKLTNGFKWLSRFVNNHNYFETTKTNFIYKFNNYLRFISSFGKSTTITYAKKSLKLIKKCQTALLNYYIDNKLTINSLNDLEQLISDYTIFKVFAIEENNETPNSIAFLLEKIYSKIAEESKNYNVNYKIALLKNEQTLYSQNDNIYKISNTQSLSI